MAENEGWQAELSYDESKIYIIRMIDGVAWKIFHDGRREKVEPEPAKEQ